MRVEGKVWPRWAKTPKNKQTIKKTTKKSLCVSVFSNRLPQVLYPQPPRVRRRARINKYSKPRRRLLRPEGKKKKEEKAGRRSKSQREISAPAQNNSAPSSGDLTIERASPAAAFSPRRCNMKCCRHSAANSDQTGQQLLLQVASILLLFLLQQPNGSKCHWQQQQQQRQRGKKPLCRTPRQHLTLDPYWLSTEQDLEKKEKKNHGPLFYLYSHFCWTLSEQCEENARNRVQSISFTALLHSGFL